MNKLLESLSQFNRREQLTLFLGVLALIVYLLWMLIFSPLQHKRNLLLTTNVSLEQSYGQVQMLAQLIQEQMQQSTQGGGVSSDSLSGLIDSSLRENGMSMSTFQPGVGGEARVRIDKANSASLMQWLYDMEIKNHIVVRELSITASNDPGQVAVNIRLLKP